MTMAMKRCDADQIDRRVLELKLSVGRLFGRIDAVHPGPDDSAESVDEPLRPVAGGIDDVLASFDALQEALGMGRGDTRHHRFLSGKCHER